MLYSLLLILYLVLYYIRPTEWVPGLVGAPLLFIVGIVSLLLLVFGMLSTKFPYLSSGNIERMVLGFVVAILLSHLTNFYIGGAIDSLREFLPTLTGFLLILCVVDSRVKVNNMVLLLLLLTAFLAYEGLHQHATGFAHGGMTPYYEKGIAPDGAEVLNMRIRWYGVFNDPNDLGLAMVIAVPFLLNLVFEKKFLLPIILLPLIGSAIYYTNSRGTVLAGLAGICSYFVFRLRSLAGVLAGGGLGVLLFLFGPSRIQMVSAEDSSAHGRIDAWYEAYQMFKSHPLFGVGQGMFTDYNRLTAHNSFVLVMAELGVFGLFFFTGLFYFPYYWLWNNLFNHDAAALTRKDIGLVSASFAALTGMLLSMFFLSRSYVLIPFMLAALCMSVTRVIDADYGLVLVMPDRNPPRHFRNVFLLTVAQIIGIYIVVKLTI